MNRTKPENYNMPPAAIESLNTRAGKLFEAQLERWPLAQSNYKALGRVETKSFSINGFTIKVQFNPARIISSTAKVDEAPVDKRKCFLCADNLPSEQEGLPWGDGYLLLVNPFPVFPVHYTIPAIDHIGQSILSRYAAMLDLAEELNEFTIFYNGPKCGASAPGHAHFQAGNKGFLPIEEDIKKTAGTIILSNEDIRIYTLENYLRHVFILESNKKEAVNSYFRRLYAALDADNSGVEPMMNILAWHENDKWVSCIFPREAHRPACCYAGNDKNILISPASVEMGGVLITPREKDFLKITASDIEQILEEVCIGNEKMELISKTISKIKN